MNLINAALARLGPPGILGLGALLFCAAFYVSGLLPLQGEITAQREAAERLRVRAPFRPVAPDSREEELQRFHNLFPRVEALPGELLNLFALARNAGLELQQGEYRLERPPAGMAAYRVTLPVRATYPQVHKFVSAVLREVPVASFDAMRFERHKATDSQIEAQLRLTIWFQHSIEAQ